MNHPQSQISNSYYFYPCTHLGQKLYSHPWCPLLSVLPYQCHHFHFLSSTSPLGLTLTSLFSKQMPELIKLITSYSIILSPVIGCQWKEVEFSEYLRWKEFHAGSWLWRWWKDWQAYGGQWDSLEMNDAQSHLLV